MAIRGQYFFFCFLFLVLQVESILGAESQSLAHTHQPSLLGVKRRASLFHGISSGLKFPKTIGGRVEDADDPGLSSAAVAGSEGVTTATV